MPQAPPGDKNALPMIASKGKNNGFWIHSRSLWWQNEGTGLLKDYVARRSFTNPRGRRADGEVRRPHRIAASRPVTASASS